MKIVFSLFLIFFPLFSSYATRTFSDSQELGILEVFFRSLYEDGEMGYVAEGVKPVSWVGCSNPRTFWQLDLDCHKALWGLAEGAKIWPKYAPEKSDLFIHISQEDSKGYGLREILVIHVPSFLRVCKENITLFKYVLGPSTTPEKLLEEITSSGRLFMDVMRNDNVLIGILLGFGKQSSLVGGQLEKLQSSTQDRDCPPYSPAFDIAYHDSSLIDLSIQQLNESYFRKHNHTPTKKPKKHFYQQNLGFSQIKDELAYWQSQSIPLPKSLAEEKPRFIYGPYGEEESKQLFTELISSQKRVQQLLQKKQFLSHVLTTIYQEQVKLIDYDQMQTPLELRTDSLDLIIARAVWECFLEVEKETRQGCLKSVFKANLDECQNQNVNWHPSGTCVEGAIAVKNQIRRANTFFSYLDTREDLIILVPKQLYYKIENKGDGGAINNHKQALLSYQFNNDESVVLSAGHKIWVDIDDTLPAFVHLLQGIKVGEKRQFYIHPSLGYGITTNLKCCEILCGTVTLHDIGDNQTSSIPSIKFHDFSFLEDEGYISKLKFDLDSCFFSMASRLGVFLKNNNQINFDLFCNHLQNLADGEIQYQPLNSKEGELLTKVAWNFHFSDGNRGGGLDLGGVYQNDH